MQIVLSTYIIGLVFWGGLFGSAVWRFGGWQGYADFANKFLKRDGEGEISSNQLQWNVVMYTVFWPLVIPLIILLLWALKKS